jgi:hypothetical protein
MPISASDAGDLYHAAAGLNTPTEAHGVPVKDRDPSGGLVFTIPFGASRLIPPALSSMLRFVDLGRTEDTHAQKLHPRGRLRNCRGGNLLTSAALAGSKGSGKPSISEITTTKSSDSSSQNLMRKSSSTGSATKLRVRKAGKGQQEY